LFDLLDKFSNLFDRTLGKWNQAPIKLELKEGATPYDARPFPIPKCHAETLKMEVERLVEIGVLKKEIDWSGLLHRLSFPRKMVPYGSSTTLGNLTKRSS
jgi:hypothetical protein